jgi:putative protease
VLRDFQRLARDEIRIEVDGKIKPGAQVYKTSDQEMLSNLAASYEQPDTIKEIEVFGNLTAKVGEEMEFTLGDKEGRVVRSTVDFIPEPAKNQPVTEANFETQLSKLGNTPYKLTDLELEVEPDLFVPISKINLLRRKAVSKLNNKRKDQFNIKEQNKSMAKDKLNLPTADQQNENKLTVSIPFALADQVIDLGVDRIYLDYSELNYNKLASLTSKAKENGIELIIKLPWIAREEIMKEVREEVTKLEATAIDGYLVPQLGAAHLVAQSDKKLIADYSLHNFNSFTINHWQQKGYEGVTLSPELTLGEVRELARKNELAKEIVVYGYLPMMITEYCPIEGVTSNFNGNENCNHHCQKQNFGLLDRKNAVRPLTTDSKSCRTIIYNSDPLYLLTHLGELLKINCSNYRLDFTFESKKEILKIIKAYQTKINNPDKSFSRIKKLTKEMKQLRYTTGHFYRGVK